MHDPMTVAHDIRRPWKDKHGWRKPVLTIWHVDPEKDGSDDSCDWSGWRISKEVIDELRDPHGDGIDVSYEQVDERCIGYRIAMRRYSPRPWWKHPKWHVHHWRFQFHPWQDFKQKRDRCEKCGERMGKSARLATSWYGDGVMHFDCTDPSDGGVTKAATS